METNLIFWIAVMMHSFFTQAFFMDSMSTHGQTFEDSIVVTSFKSNVYLGRDVYIIPFQATSNQTVQVDTDNAKYFTFLNVDTRLISIDMDYEREMLYFFEARSATIYGASNFGWEHLFDNSTLSTVHKGASHATVKLAIDRVSNILYWTDPLFRWIGIQSLSKNETFYKILIKDDLSYPVGIAVSPVHKYLFFGDAGIVPRIERSTLDGRERETIVSQGILYPLAIDVDQVLTKIVWVDISRDTVETANFDGTGRRIIRRVSHSTFLDVAVFKNVIFVSDYNTGKVMILDKNTGEEFDSSPIELLNDDKLAALAIMSSSGQPDTSNYCENSLCSDICVNDASGPVCICKEGYKLDTLNQNCIEDEAALRAFVWSNTTHICRMDLRAINAESFSDVQTCFYTSGANINYLDIDSHTRQVIYADGSNIYKVNIDGSAGKERLTTATDDVTGLAVDWRDKNIYWCQGRTTSGKIMMISQQDVFPLVIGLSYPRAITILPHKNILVWVSGTELQYKIEKSQLDGSERTTIVSLTSLMPPGDIAVDAVGNKLYFIDQYEIKTCLLDGTGLSTLLVELDAPQKLIVYKNHLLIFEDYGSATVTSFDTVTADTLLSDFLLDSLTDFKVLDITTQPGQHGPCDILNGDCEQICIPAGRNRLCQCEYGFQLDADRQTCFSGRYRKVGYFTQMSVRGGKVSAQISGGLPPTVNVVPLLDNFLLVADWTHNKVYQVSLVDNRISALDSGMIKNPNCVACNPYTRELIWGDTSTKLVQRVSLNSTGYTILADIDELGSFPDRFAIDYTTGDIYYTAVPTELGAFAGIGVISPNGYNSQLVHFGNSPRAIQLDVAKRLMFWTDFGTDPSVLMQAHMDGSNMRTLNTKMIWPNGLAIDVQAQLLYITDGYTNTISRCTYSGVCAVYHSDPGAHLMDIKLDGEYLYYTAWNRVYVTKIHKYYSWDRTQLATNAELGRLDAICIYNSYSVPIVIVVSSSVSPLVTERSVAKTATVEFKPVNGAPNLLLAIKPLTSTTTTTTTTRTTTPTTSGTTLTTTPSTKPVTQPPTRPRTSRTNSKSTTTVASGAAVTDAHTDTILGLSKPSLIGVFAGIGALVIVIVAVLCIVCCRTRNKRSTNTSTNVQDGRSFEPPPSYQESKMQGIQFIAPSHQNPIREPIYDVIGRSYNGGHGPEKDNATNYLQFEQSSALRATPDRLMASLENLFQAPPTPHRTSPATSDVYLTPSQSACT